MATIDKSNNNVLRYAIDDPQIDCKLETVNNENSKKKVHASEDKEEVNGDGKQNDTKGNTILRYALDDSSRNNKNTKKKVNASEEEEVNEAGAGGKILRYALDDSSANNAQTNRKIRTTGGASNKENDAADGVPGAAPALPSLRRNTNVSPIAAPGAVAMAGPGGDEESALQVRSRAGSAASAGSGASINSTAPAADPAALLEEGHSEGLVRAQPVEEPDIVAVDAVDLNDRKRNNQRSRKWHGLALAGVAVFAIALAVALVLLGTKDKEESIATAVPATVSPTTAAPTTMAQSLSPLVQRLDLPDHTVRAIASTPDSPQARAYQWLLEDPRFLAGNHSDWKARQRFALATIYYALGGEEWDLNDHWMDHGLDECRDWYFRNFDAAATRFEFAYPPPSNTTTPSACDEEGRYKDFIHPKNNMVGFVPPEIALLTSLRFFDVSKNTHITQSIPTQVGLLAKLSTIKIDRNEITGSIPTQLGLLTDLTYVYLSPNSLTGSIPTELANLGATLLYLGLARAPGITGYLPTELFRLTTLHELHVQNLKGVTGGTLEGIGALTNLRRLTAHDVKYNSNVPSEIGLLTKLSILNLWNTGVKGSLPKELWRLTDMEYLDIDDNELTGTFPVELSAFSSLKSTWMNGNGFSGTLPPSVWRHMGNLTTLKMNGNRVVGPIPSEVGLMTNMEEIWFADMQTLTGTVPTQLGGMSALEKLFLHSNPELTGTIPASLAQLTALEMVTVTNTSIDGAIPEALCDSLHDMVFTCGTYFGVTEQLCTDVEPRPFSCNSSMLCGCDYCEPCGEGGV